jgi:hypothetical protein
VHQLREEVWALKNTIQSVHDQNEARHKQHEAERALSKSVVEIDAEKHEKPTPERDGQANNNFDRGIQLALAIGTWLAFGAAAYYACIASGQLRTMNETYGQVEKQTRVLQQQLSGTQGAVLRLETEMLWDGFHIVITNLRPVSAQHINGKIEITRISLPGLNPIGTPRDIAIDIPVVPSDSTGQFNKTYSIPFGWREKRWEKAESPPVTFTVAVDFSYEDGFTNVVKSRSCDAWMPVFAIRNKKGGTVNGGGFYPCDDFANAIRQRASLMADAAKGIYH